MTEQDIIRERLRRKETEITGLEEKLRSARIYLQALQDVLKAVSRDAEEDDTTLRPGSSVAQARDLILSAGRPVHVNELLEALGRGGSREGRASLTGSLSAYVRRGEIFTRPAPNTFGLIEAGHAEAEREQIEPPKGFGRAVVEDEVDETPF